jgi:pilus assembly protein CpaE
MKTLLILDNFDIQQSLVNSLSEAGVQSQNIIPCSYKDAGLFLKDTSIELMLLEVGHNPQMALQFTDMVKTANVPARLIPIIHNKDSDLILQLIKRGIADVLVMPIDTNELQDIIKKFKFTTSSSSSNNHQNTSAFRGKVVTVTSYKGGTGVSTIATNLAFCMAELDAVKKKTLIVDMANQSNHCSVLLNAQPVLTINQICKEVARVESAYIFSSVTWVGPNLAIIGTDLDIGGVQPLDFDALKRAIDLFTESFEFVIIDLPTHTFDGRFLASIDNADQVLVVSSVDITSIRDTRLYLNMLRSLGCDNSKLRLLINRYDCESGMFKTKDLEQALQNAISFYVPNDFKTITEAAHNGQAVLEYKPNTMLAEALAELAIGVDNGSMFIPPKVDNKKKLTGGLGNLFSGLGR